MSKLARPSPVLLSRNEESVITFLAKSFYQSKLKKSAYLNPLDRQKLRMYLKKTSLPIETHQIVNGSVRGNSKLVQKRNQRVKKFVKKPGTKPKIRRNMQGRTEGTSSSSQKIQNSPKQITKDKSLKIAKKGVKLYLQKWRRELAGKRKVKRAVVKSSTRGVQKDVNQEKSRQQPSASRSLAFGKTTDTQTVTDPTECAKSSVANRSSSLKRELHSDEGSLSRRPKRRMKTGAESMDSAGGEEKFGLGRDDHELEEWLWSPWEESTSDMSQGTPKSFTEVKPAASPTTDTSSSPNLYPLFTPPVTPSSSSSGSTPSRRELRTQKRAGTLHTPEPKSPSSWQKLRDKDGMEQMVLDLGQKYFGAVSCDTCGMVYTATHPEDEANHAKFHRKYLSCTKFNGWKNEEVIEEFPDGRIIMIGPESPKFAHKKVEEIRALVDRELGFVEGNTLSGKDLCKTFLFITSDKKIAGCLIAEGIRKGYRVIPDKEPKPVNPSSESQKAWCCETDPSPVVCGVSRIWVAGLTRRKKIASRLMEALRCHYTFGSVLTMDDIAFSDPTPDGKLFATAFSKTPRFLVYKYT